MLQRFSKVKVSSGDKKYHVGPVSYLEKKYWYRSENNYFLLIIVVIFFNRGLNYYTWENEEKLVERTEVKHPKLFYEVMDDSSYCID